MRRYLSLFPLLVMAIAYLVGVFATYVDGYFTECGLKSSDLDLNRTAHGLRHTTATLGLSAGASLREVQNNLGHSDPKQTAVYAGIDKFRAE